MRVESCGVACACGVVWSRIVWRQQPLTGFVLRRFLLPTCPRPAECRGEPARFEAILTAGGELLLHLATSFRARDATARQKIEGAKRKTKRET